MGEITEGSTQSQLKLTMQSGKCMSMYCRLKGQLLSWERLQRTWAVFLKKYYHLILCEMATIHQFDNNPEEDEFYLVEIYWFITYTLVEPSINQQFIHDNTTRLL